MDAALLIRSYGGGPVGGAADCAASHGHVALAEALRASAKWAEPSRFLRDASAERTRAALRGGADIVTLAGEPLGSAISPPRFAEMCSLDGPSRMYALGVLGAARAEKFAEAGSVAALVRAAAAPWSTSSHELFPDQARADPNSHHLNLSLSSLDCVSDGVPVAVPLLTHIASPRHRRVRARDFSCGRSPTSRALFRRPTPPLSSTSRSLILCRGSSCAG